MGAAFTFEQLAPTTATATDNAKTAAGGKTAQKMIVTVSVQNCRMEVGANPTSSVGLLLVTGEVYEFTGYDLIDDARFIEVVSGSIVDVQYVLL